MIRGQVDNLWPITTLILPISVTSEAIWGGSCNIDFYLNFHGIYPKIKRCCCENSRKISSRLWLSAMNFHGRYNSWTATFRPLYGGPYWCGCWTQCEVPRLCWRLSDVRSLSVSQHSVYHFSSWSVRCRHRPLDGSKSSVDESHQDRVAVGRL